MTHRTKVALGIGAGVLLLAGGIFVLIGGRDAISHIPVIGRLAAKPKCPLTGRSPAHESVLKRPAVAVKVENNPAAYPLSGLEKADVVFEEEVEGGLSRFMAIYHCGDATKVGPVRSARVVDPDIMRPITRILADAGSNAIVDKALAKAHITVIDELSAGAAMRRVPRPGISSEHTLYANTAALRKIGKKHYKRPPADDIFKFGGLQKDVSKKARTITINFSSGNIAGYKWSKGHWLRFQDGSPMMAESGHQIAVTDVIIEQHKVNYSKTIVDVLGNPSTEIADVTGSGRAVLFRDGRAIKGKWSRSSISQPVHFSTRSGDEMQLKPGNVWIELVPSQKGDVKGSFSFAK
ncbi:MAG: DUF3048 domain-containing protein [Actinomycetota bacterium]|nr:DUF3048 domain-containing protein [Actinomycetota bacterium]